MINIHKSAVYLPIVLILFLFASCSGVSENKQKDEKVTNNQTTNIGQATSTANYKKGDQTTPTDKRVLTPTVVVTPSEKPFQLYGFLPAGEYLIIGTLKQYALSLDGKKKLPLPTNVDLLSSARVSPDGSRIAIVSSEAGVPNSAFFRVLNPISGGQADIPRVKGCTSADPPGWSPEGSLLVFACVDKIIMLSVPNGEEKGRIVFNDIGYPDSLSVHRPLWSPNGKWIAYRSSDGRVGPNLPGDQVIVFSADCFSQPTSCLKNAKKFSFQGKSSYNLFDWTTSNELIMLDQENTKVIIYNVISGDILQSFSLPSTFTVENFAVSPEGTQIAFGQRTSDEKEAAIYVASLKDGAVKKIYAENYRVNINFVNIWIKTR